MNAHVLDSIKKSAAVPSMPQVVLRFLEIMRDPEFQYPDLVRALSADPGTVSEILRLANSALFGIRNKVISIEQALTLLGPKRTRSLLLGRYLVDTMNKRPVDGLDMKYFWRRSLASSVVATHFARTVAPRAQDAAFLGGLLGRIGIPILAEAMPDCYGPIAARFAPAVQPVSADEELDAVGATHAQVSAMVLDHWQLPEMVTTAVNLHLSAHPGEGPTAQVARILNAADRISRVLCETAPIDEVADTCLTAIAVAGVEADVLVKVLPSIESDIEELADALRIDVVPGNVYSLIAEGIQKALSIPS